MLPEESVVTPCAMSTSEVPNCFVKALSSFVSDEVEHVWSFHSACSQDVSTQSMTNTATA